jgi:hypothetical protein
MNEELNERARQRRVTAARVSRDLATEKDLDALLGTAQHGLGVLFDGECTVQLAVGDQPQTEWLPSQGVREEAVIGLTGPPSHDVVNERAGILLTPTSLSGVCRAWVQFTTPRRVSADELVVADLFAQAFAIAVDRIASGAAASQREAALRRAIDGHRIIGQATGIMMERHRLTAALAFDLLRSSSQNRNLKLRELAERIITTGAEPDQA